MNVALRNAKIEDAKDIAEVRVVTWQKTYHGLLPAEFLATMNIEKETQAYREGIANLPLDRYFCVAEIDTLRKRVVGYSICGPLRDPNAVATGEIYQVYVLPEYQGQNIGRSLVQSAARWLAFKGYRRLIIFVLSTNIPARKFYEAIGGVAERERTREIDGFPAPEVGYAYDLFDTGLLEIRAHQRGTKVR